MPETWKGGRGAWRGKGERRATFKAITFRKQNENVLGNS